MPKRFAGYNLGPITLIRPDNRNDVGLHDHEAVHRDQFYKNPFMGLFYLFSKKARMKYEVAAYKAQLRSNPRCEELYAGYLSTNYNLGITFQEALEALNENSAN